MLAPLRDYLRPKDPKSSSLLCATKERYFARMSVGVDPDKPGPREARWITSEDVNVEHLLDVFTSTDANSDDIWDACGNFMTHLSWHKGRLITLGPKIEGLVDDHPSKPQCLYRLAELFEAVGNQVERERLLTHVLKLERERENDHWVARALRNLSDENRLTGLYEEGIQLVEEALEVFEQLGETAEQVSCLKYLAWVLYEDEQLDATEEAASRSIHLLLGEDEQYLVCGSHRVLGEIYHSKGEREKAIYHFEAALGIASSFNWDEEIFWVHYALAHLFSDEDEFDEAHAHIERAKSHAVNNPYYLGRAVEMQANFWYEQHRFEGTKSEVLRTVEAYEKVGAAADVDRCRELFRTYKRS